MENFEDCIGSSLEVKWKQDHRRGSHHLRGHQFDQSHFARALRFENLESRLALAIPNGPIWIEQGPGPITHGQVLGMWEQNDPVAGAINAVAPHPSDPNTLLVATVNGGIWRTTNATSKSPNYTSATDGLNSLAIGDIAYSPINPDFVFAANGCYSNGSLVGCTTPADFLRSSDGGVTWTALSLSSSPLAGFHVNSVVPTGAGGSTFDSQVIFVGAGHPSNAGSGGVFRSNDGGRNWLLLSGSNGLPNGYVSHLVVDPGDSQVLYAAYPRNGIFVTKNGGMTWTNITPAPEADGFDNDEDGTIDDTVDLTPTVDDDNDQITDETDETSEKFLNTEWIKLAVHDSANGNVIYAALAGPVLRDRDKGNTGTRLWGVWRSISQGTTWGLIPMIPITDKPEINPGGQGFPNLSLVADPVNPNVVFVGGDFNNSIGDFGVANIYRGNVAPPDGSPIWYPVVGGFVPGTHTGTAPHADSRDMAFSADKKTLIETDDGGIYRLFNPNDVGHYWESMNGDIRPTEIYSVAYDSINNILLAGAQDTGTFWQTIPYGKTWDTAVTAICVIFCLDYQRLVGDGGSQAVDNTGPNSIRYSLGNNFSSFYRSTFDPANNKLDTEVVKLRAPFNPLELSGLNNTDRDFGGFTTFPFALNSVDPLRLALGGDGLYESSDRGETIADITPYTSPLPTGTMRSVSAIVYGGRANGVDNPEVMYVAMTIDANNDGKLDGNDQDVLYLRTSANGVFNPISAGISASSLTPLSIRDLAIDPNDWRRIYLADGSGRIFFSSDAGTNWLDITGDLFSGPLSAQSSPQSIEIRRRNVGGYSADLVLVGAMDGVYVTTAPNMMKYAPIPSPPPVPPPAPSLISDAKWVRLGGNLPNVPVADLDYDPTDDILVAGTFGRGVWTVENVSEKFALSTIEGTAFNDVNNDGLQETTQKVVSGVTVKLWNTVDGVRNDGSTFDNDVKVYEVTTSSVGHYAFQNVLPGNYYLEYTLPDAFTLSPKDQGSDDERDSDVDHTTKKTATFFVDVAETITKFDVGMFGPDRFEENDTPETARAIGVIPGIHLKNLSISTANDDDFYLAEYLCADEDFRVRIQFQSALGNLDLAVEKLQSDGSAIPVGSRSGSANEVSVLVSKTAGPGTYRFRVFGTAPEVRNVYDLSTDFVGSGARVFFVNDAASEEDFYTLAAGNDSNAGDNPNSPKASVQSVLDSYDLGTRDLVLIDDGFYGGTVLLSDGDEAACGFAGVPDGQSRQSATWDVVDAEFNTFYSLGFSLGNPSIHLRGTTGLGSSLNKFRKNYFDSNVRALWIEGGTDNVISDNTFRFTTESIVLNGGLTTVSKNLFLDLSNAIIAQGTASDNADVLVDNNSFSRVTHGVRLNDFTQNAEVRNNLFNEGTGTAVYTNSTADIHDNEISNTFVGVQLGSSSQATVRANTFKFITIGVDSDSKQSSVFGNTIRGANAGITGLGIFGGTDWSAGQPNDIFDSLTGIYPMDEAVVRFNRIHENATGILAEHGPISIHHNLIYRNDQHGILVSAANGFTAHDVDIENNTIYAEFDDEPTTYGVRLQNNVRDIHLRNNIVWASGPNTFGIHVASDSQRGFSSDYNNLFSSNDGVLVHWQKPFRDLFDWQVEAGFDNHSIGTTALAPDLDNPRFVDLANNDYHLSGFGSANMSTSIDAGDPASLFAFEPNPNGGHIDLGAYGNTAEASASKPSYIILSYPRYYTDFDPDSGRAIEWNASNVTGSVKIELFEEGVGIIDEIAIVDVAEGAYGWSPSESGVTGSVDRRFAVIVSSVDAPTVAGRSRELFSVPPAGTDYYLDDSSNLNDEYTPSATGDNRNTGKTPGDPKANLISLLRSYDLAPGDTVHFDTGDYINVQNAVLSGNPGIGDDEGISLIGPTNSANVARIDRANGNEGSANIELNDADFVTLQRLTLVGANRGIWMHSQSTNVTATDLIVSNNSGPGILVEADTTSSNFARLTATNNGGDGISIAAPITSLMDSVARDNTGTGISLRNQLSTVVTGNQAINNARGIEASGGITNFSSNFAHANDQYGFSVTTGLVAAIEKNESSENSTGLIISANASNVTVVGNTDLSLNRGNKIHDNLATGVDATGNVLVAGNSIYRQFLGSGLILRDHADAMHNVVYSNRDGIVGTIFSNSDIVGNRVYDAVQGIQAYHDSNIRENVVYTTTYGIHVSGFVYASHLNPFIGEITNNLVYRSVERGVTITLGGTGMSFANNTVYNIEGLGAVLVDASPGYISQDVDLRNNILSVKSGYAITVENDSQLGFASDFNILRATDTGAVGLWQDVARANLNAWRNASFTDVDSTSADPLLVDPDGIDDILGFVTGVSTGFDDDFHEQSMFGSHHGGSFAPVVDDATGLPVMPTIDVVMDSQQSPAVDRGDPTSDFSNEPIPNGGYVNLGTYGNTNQASKSPIEYVLVTQPDGGEIWPQEQTFTVKWRSHDLNGNVDINLVSSNGATTIANIAAGTANDGTFDWTIPSPATAPPATFTPGNYKVAVERGSLRDTSNDPFEIAGPIHFYYVNDGSTANDVFTSAPGDDGNSGLFANAPKASVRAVLEAYDLGPGDVIRVDTGYYTPSANILITENDSGVRIEGPSPAVSPFYRTAVLEDSPVAYWRLNETNGGTASDLSGGFHGTFEGNPSLGETGVTQADQDTAVRLDGIDDRIDLGSGVDMIAQHLTLEAWINPDRITGTGSTREIISRYSPAVPQQGTQPAIPEKRQYRLALSADNELIFEIATVHIVDNKEVIVQNSSKSGRITPGVFTHVAATYDGAQMRWYISGKEVLVINAFGAIARVDGPNNIGAFGTTNLFQGTMDEVAVYARALTAAEIRQHNNLGISRYGAILDRNNSSSGSKVFELNNADDITLDHLSMVGADYGVAASQGSDSDNLTISFSSLFGHARGGVAMAESNDNATVSASQLFGFSSNTTSDDQTRGIELLGHASAVTGNDVHHSSEIGIYVTEGIVQNNSSHDNQSRGIFISNGFAAANVAFYNSSAGIVLGRTGQANGNTVHDNGVGLLADELFNTVENNTAFANTIGIHTTYNATDVDVNGNTTYSNKEAGIDIQSTNGVARNNVAYDNKDGIRAILASGIRLENNRAYHNSQAGIHGYNNTRLLNNTTYDNKVGVHADSYVIYGGLVHFTGSVENNLSYDNTIAGITIDGNGVEVFQNTVYQPVGDAIVLENNDSFNVGSVNIRLRNNVLQVNTGYDIRVTAESQVGFDSDYNLLQTTGTGKIGLWQGVEFTRQEDWFYEIGQDMHSFTADPNFENPSGADGLLGYSNGADHGRDDDFDFASTSPTIDQGDPWSYYLSEPEPNGNRANMGHRGNSPLATLSPSKTLQILSPNGLEKLENGHDATIQWHTSGYTAVDTVALMNAGGATVDNWLADRYDVGYAAVQQINGDIDLTGVGDPAPEEVYQSFAMANYGVGSKLTYSLAVPSGDYNLRLHFVEPYYSVVGYRVFDIQVGGSVVRSKYDIVAEAGQKLKATTLTLPVSSVNGSIVLALVNQAQSDPAVLSGIELTRPNSVSGETPTFDLAITSTESGPTTPLATDQPLDRFGRGLFHWTVSGVETLTARMHVDDGQSDTSDKNFVIANGGADYYVDDGSNTTDIFTPNAIGNNANSGKSPESPMATLAALIDAYDLDAGDVIHVDSGSFSLVRNVVLAADDSGARIQGSTTIIPTLNRGNFAPKSYIFELQNALDITLDRLAATGAVVGIYAADVVGDTASGSDRLRVSQNHIFDNSTHGVLVGIGNDQIVVTQSELSGVPDGSPNDNQTNGVVLNGLDTVVSNNTISANLQGTGILVKSGTVMGNTVSVARRGIDSQGGAVEDNEVHHTDVGIYADGYSRAIRIVRNRTYENRIGISGDFMVTIGENSSTNNSAEGILVSYGSQPVISQNYVSGNVNGIVAGIFATDAVVRDNTAVHNSSRGILAYQNTLVSNNKAYSNSIGISGNLSSTRYSGEISNNLVYENTSEGIVVTGSGAQILNNTVLQPIGNAVRIDPDGVGSSNIQLRNNILQADMGYLIRVADTGQAGFDSDYNLLFPEGTAKVASWQGQEFATLADWFYDVGFDRHSSQTNPGFIDDTNGADDLLGYANGVDHGADDNFAVKSTSPTIDAGDLQTYYLAEPSPNGGRANLGHTGNTSLAANSAEYFVQVLSPNGLEKLESGQTAQIEWRAFAFNLTEYVALINVGGQTVQNWLVDRYSLLDASANTINESIDLTGVTDPGPLEVYKSFASAPYGLGKKLAYSLPVEAGAYTIRLHFVEPFTFVSRPVDIRLENTTVQSNFDIANAAGDDHKATTLSFPVTASADGIQLELVTVGDYPAILSGIELTRANPIGYASPKFDLDLTMVEGGGRMGIVSGQDVDRFGRGSYSWVVGGETNTARVHVTSEADTATDRSDNTFIIANAGRDFYVDDGSNADDEFTPAAVGDNRNSGKSANSPMRSIQGLLNAFNLDPGDVIHVDTGNYNVVRNIVITAEDSGVVIEGPHGPGVAVLNRNNPSTGSYVFELQVADNIGLDRLSITGGQMGVYAGQDANSDGFTLSNSLVFNNADAGVRFEQTNDNATVRNSMVFGSPSGVPTDNQSYGVRLFGSNSSVVGNTVHDTNTIAIEVGDGSVAGNTVYSVDGGSTGISLDKGTASANNVNGKFAVGIVGKSEATLSGNTVRNSQVGLSVGLSAIARGNTVFGNSDTGIWLEGGQAISNVAHSNTTGIRGYGLIDSNRVFNNANIGIQATLSTQVSNNTVYSNSIGIIGDYGFFTYFNGAVINNRIYANANQGLIMVARGSRVESNTIYQPVGEAVKLDGSSQNLTLRNNILWVDAGYDLYLPLNSQTGLVSDFNLLFNGPSPDAKVAFFNNADVDNLTAWQTVSGQDANGLDIAPEFVDVNGADNIFGYSAAGNGFDGGYDDNFHFLRLSPAIDRGDATGAPTVDREGNSRIDDAGTTNYLGSIVDLGSDEFQGSSLDTNPPKVLEAAIHAHSSASGPFSEIHVAFSEPVDHTDALAPANYELRGAGPNHTFDDSDDIIYVLVPAHGRGSSEVVIQVLVPGGGVLPTDDYRFVVSGNSTIHDLAGNRLDGDNDGQPGGNSTGVNHSPILDAISNTFTVDEGGTVSFALSAGDTDAGQSLKFRLDADAPAGATINESTGAFSWTTSEANGAGVYTISVTVTDNGSPSLSDLKTFTVVVNELNSAPILTPIGDKIGAVGRLLTFAAVATDPDLPAGSAANTLTYLLGQDAPFGSAINPMSGVFTWVPNATFLGQQVDIVILVKDAGSPALQDSETITVTVNESNSAPSTINLSNSSVKEKISGLVVGTLSVVDSDPDQTHTYTVDDSRFEIVGSTLKLKSDQFLTSPPATVDLEVTATDSGSPPQSLTQTLTIDIVTNIAPWQYEVQKFDANADGFVVPQDVLRIINLLNNPTILEADGKLPVSRPADSILPYYDINGDGYCSSNDVLRIINYLNTTSGGGEPAGDALDVTQYLMLPILAFDSDVEDDDAHKEIVDAAWSECEIEGLPPAVDADEFDATLDSPEDTVDEMESILDEIACDILEEMLNGDPP